MPETMHPLINVLGVDIHDITMDQALDHVETLLGSAHVAHETRCTHAIYFVNAHTLNLACRNPDYHALLRRGDTVFGDGTGVRWGAHLLRGVRLRDNVNGTDLIPALFERLAGRGLRYFLLGATENAIRQAAEHAREAFSGWALVGYHQGYVDDECQSIVRIINNARPDVLLVGMGNPRQEQWIDANRDRLRVPVTIGVGGLFTYWSGDLERAPAWMRGLGQEWLYLLLRQPHKAKRYLIGNPRFLARLAWAKWSGE